MVAVLLKLVPFRDYVYAALAIGAVVFYNAHVHKLEAAAVAHEVAAVQAAGAKVMAAANAQIASINQQHAADVAKVQATYEQQISAASAQHDADLRRLRVGAAGGQHGGGPVLGSSSSASSSAGGGDGGAVGLATVPGELALKLADALRQDDAALQACYTDRDNLTGK